MLACTSFFAAEPRKMKYKTHQLLLRKAVSLQSQAYSKHLRMDLLTQRNDHCTRSERRKQAATTACPSGLWYTEHRGLIAIGTTRQQELRGGGSRAATGLPALAKLRFVHLY
jgi:hypothetical protein